MRRIACFFRMIASLLLLCVGELALGAAPQDASPWRETELAKDWKLKAIEPRASLDAAVLAEAEKAEEAKGWLGARAMPAMIHDILLARGKIDPPWLPGGTEKCLWVADRDWIYAVRFAAQRPGRQNWLQFKGLEGPSRRISQRRAHCRARRHGRAADGRCQRPASLRKHTRAALPFVRAGSGRQFAPPRRPHQCGKLPRPQSQPDFDWGFRHDIPCQFRRPRDDRSGRRFDAR